MTNTKGNYQGLYTYAKANFQNRNLYNEYWQQDQRQTPKWQATLNPELKRIALPTVEQLRLPVGPVTELSQTTRHYEGLFDYARQNAVHRDLFKDSVHMNLANWQANLRSEKGAQFTETTFQKAA